MSDPTAREARRRSALLKEVSIATVGALLSLLAVIASVSTSGIDAETNQATGVSLDEGQMVRSELAELAARVEKIDEAVKRSPASDAAVSNTSTLHELSTAQQTIKDRLRSIESAMFDSPERAVALLLLREELNALEKRIGVYQESTHTEIDRLYQQQNWMLGGIGSFVLLLVGSIIAKFWSASPKAEGSQA